MKCLKLSLGIGYTETGEGHGISHNSFPFGVRARVGNRSLQGPTGSPTGTGCLAKVEKRWLGVLTGPKVFWGQKGS